jgi:hypothetical protein
MDSDINLPKRMREEARWCILRILNAGRPIGVNLPVILRVLEDSHLGCTPHILRRELDYLQDLKLIETGEEYALETGEEYAFGKLTAYGVAVVEYNTPAPPGIARPRQKAD